MLRGLWLAACGCLCICWTTTAFAENARSSNFLVLTARDSETALADAILRHAEVYRREIAMDLFGEALPEGIGRTTVNYTQGEKDRGLTWATSGSSSGESSGESSGANSLDSNSPRNHVVYLSGDSTSCLGGPLRHEMVHVILATRFPGDARLPAWIEEGLASRYDHNKLIQRRREIVGDWLRTNKIPSISRVLAADNIAAQDQSAYTVSATLIDYLLEVGGRERLMAFAAAVPRDGVDKAISQQYSLRDTSDLERHWKAWLKTQITLKTASR